MIFNVAGEVILLVEAASEEDANRKFATEIERRLRKTGLVVDVDMGTVSAFISESQDGEVDI